MSTPTIDELLARLPRDGCLTVSMIGHRWSAGIRIVSNGSWAFHGAPTAVEAVRAALAAIPAPKIVDDIDELL